MSADTQPLREEILIAVDEACWSARSWYGHTDYGLDDYDTGQPIEDGIHPQARTATDAIIRYLLENYL